MIGEVFAVMTLAVLLLMAVVMKKRHEEILDRFKAIESRLNDIHQTVVQVRIHQGQHEESSRNERQEIQTRLRDDTQMLVQILGDFLEAIRTIPRDCRCRTCALIERSLLVNDSARSCFDPRQGMVCAGCCKTPKTSVMFSSGERLQAKWSPFNLRTWSRPQPSPRQPGERLDGGH